MKSLIQKNTHLSKAVKYYSVNLIRISKSWLLLFISIVKKLEKDLRSYSLLKNDNFYGSKTNSYNDPP